MIDTTHPLYFIRSAAKERKEWLGQAPLEADCHIKDGEQFCTVTLPVPAPDGGSWMIYCEACPAWALVNTRGSIHDPKSFTMPCGRIHFKYE